MKKIITLLFCVVAMALTASANDRVDMCVNVLLGNEMPNKLMAANLDANHDGVITIHDLSVIIDEALQAQAAQPNKAPAQEVVDVDAIINKVLTTETGEPNISDVNQAIDHNLNQQKK